MKWVWSFHEIQHNLVLNSCTRRASERKTEITGFSLPSSRFYYMFVAFETLLNFLFQIHTLPIINDMTHAMRVKCEFKLRGQSLIHPSSRGLLLERTISRKIAHIMTMKSLNFHHIFLLTSTTRIQFGIIHLLLPFPCRNR